MRILMFASAIVPLAIAFVFVNVSALSYTFVQACASYAYAFRFEFRYRSQCASRHVMCIANVWLRRVTFPKLSSHGYGLKVHAFKLLLSLCTLLVLKVNTGRDSADGPSIAICHDGCQHFPAG
jgi:hypothetical protein